MKPPHGQTPTRWIITRANSAYEPHIARPTPNKPPVYRQIERHELPSQHTKGGQGRSDESVSADAVVLGWCAVIFVVTGLVCLLLVLTK